MVFAFQNVWDSTTCILCCAPCYALGKISDEVSSDDGSKSLEGVESHSDGDRIPPQSKDISMQSIATKPVNTCTYISLYRRLVNNQVLRKVTSWRSYI